MKLSGLATFAVSVFVFSLAFLTQDKSAAQNSISEAPRLSPEKFVGAIKSVPQSIKNAKSAGIVFEERNLFHSTTANAAGDARLRVAVSDGSTFDLNNSELLKILNENPRFLDLPLTDGILF